LLPHRFVDRGVIATATELFEARHYPGVVAMCSDALDDEPECVPLLLVRARARMALRRDLDAQADLRDVIRLDPRCALAYRLLGELAARSDDNASAASLFREALRLDPGDREAHDWLMIVSAPSRTAAAATPLPAPAAAAGHVFPRPTESRPTEPWTRPASQSQIRLARGTQPPDPPDLIRSTPAIRPTPLTPPTPTPVARPQARLVDQGDERPTQPFGCVVDRSTPPPARPRTAVPVRPTPTPEPLPPPPELSARNQTPELPGFGEYLVAAGILSRERLRAAQAYQRSMKVQLSTAIVTLGLASPQRIEWAAVAHQSQMLRDRP
jgi:tetratricopeptide (TPR) repeat protein